LNNGTLYNGTNVCNGNDCPSWVSDTPAGYGYAIEFDGDNDSVRIANIPQIPPDPTNGPISILLWFKTPDATPPEVKYLFSDNWNEISFHLTPSGYLRAQVYQTVTSLQPVTENEWHFAALSYDYDSLTLRFYLDGVFQGSTSVTIGNGFKDPPFCIGCDYEDGDSEGHFNGTIDKVVIYLRALSEKEIRQHYEAKRAKFIEFVESKPDLSKAISFDGIDDQVIVPPSTTLNVQNYTLEFWIKFTHGVYGEWRQIIAKHAPGSDRSPGIWICPTTLGLHWRHNPGNLGSLCLGPEGEGTNFEINRWYHIAGVKNGTAFKIYINGAQIGPTYTIPDPIDQGDGNLYIGRTSYSPAGFFIDEVRILNRTLSEEEIKADYENSKVWIRLKEIKANSNASVIMYYGNEGASDESDGDEVFDLFINFARDGIISYGGGGQDINPTQWGVVDDVILRMWGNNWKASMRSIDVIGDGSQAISFWFKSIGEQGEINGIGLDNDNSISESWFYRIYGTQSWGRSDHYGYAANFDWQFYTLILDDYSGSFDRFVFCNDADAGQKTNVFYKNIRVRKYSSPEPVAVVGDEIG
jgi:hypothetical protein